MKKKVKVLVGLVVLLGFFGQASVAHASSIEEDVEVALDGVFEIVEPEGKEVGIMDIFEDNMSDLFYTVLAEGQGNIRYYILAPKSDVQHLIVSVEEGNPEAKYAWDSITKTLADSASSIQTVLVDSETDPKANHYVLIMLDYEDYGKYVFATHDGDVLYDGLNGIDEMDTILDLME